MQRWDYQRLNTWDEVIQAGQEGWELVSVMSLETGEAIYYLKRPFLSIREEITLSQKEQVLSQKERLS